MTMTKKSMDFINDPEGKTFIAGVVIAVLFSLWVSVSHFWMPGKTPAILAVTGAHVMAGRAVGIYLGLTVGLDFNIVLMINIIIDTLWVLLLYPIAIFSMKRLLFFHFIEKSINKIIKAAERHRGTIKRYGLWGLFLFVLCPLPMTGPVVGGVIGNLIGLRTRTNMGIVLSATYAALAIWGAVLVGIHHKIQTQSPTAPILVLALLIGIGLIGRLFYKKDKDH